MDWQGIIIASVTTISGLSGAIIGGYISNRGQREIFKEQLKEEDRKFKRERLFKGLQICNDFIEAEGRNGLIGDENNPLLDVDAYQEHMRPILFEDITCLPNNLVNLIIKMDNEIIHSNYFGESSKPSKNELGDWYAELVREVVQHIKTATVESYKDVVESN